MKDDTDMIPQFDVFLSHSSVDKPWVIKLKDDLLRYGVSVWLDKDEIRPGDLFGKALEQALDNCRAVALIVSPAAIASGWVEEEYYRALSLAKAKQSPVQIIPVILQEAELPGFLQSRNWVDFKDKKDYAQSVWKLVWGIVGKKPAQVLNLSIPTPVLTSKSPPKPVTANQVSTPHSTSSDSPPDSIPIPLSPMPETDSDPVSPFPQTLQELIQKDETCASLLQREELIRDVKENLFRTPKSYPFIVLYGQPMVGKTIILNHLSEVLDDQYVPLMVTCQGLNVLDSLDAFAFDLVNQFIVHLKKWVKRYGVSIAVNAPTWNDFTDGKGRQAFYACLDNLQQMLGQKQTVIIIDEIEHLLDHPQKLNPQILDFLEDFICHDNGYFILAGSEYILDHDNESFKRMIRKGYAIQVGYYDPETVKAVFSVLQQQFTFRQDTLKSCMALCDGHPRLLEVVFGAVVYQATKSADNHELDQSDFDSIAAKVIERANYLLWAMWQRLSFVERALVWPISQTFSGPIYRLEYTLSDLAHLAEEYLAETPLDSESLAKGATQLADRELMEWIDTSKELFRFKLGVLILWLRYQEINLE